MCKLYKCFKSFLNTHKNGNNINFVRNYSTMPIKQLFILLTSIIILSCQNKTEVKNPGDPILEKIAGKDYAKMIEIPTTPDGQVDTSNTAIIQLQQATFDFDTIFQGDKAEHTFHFTNTGKKELYILQTNTSCGCTVPEYSKDPVAPGEKGSIHVIFDSTGKKGAQNRRISLITNAFPSEKIIRMTGYVQQLD